MKPSELIPGVRYKVTKASNDGTLQVNDQISRADDGSIICHDEDGGWLDKKDVAEALEGVDMAIDIEYGRRRLSMLRARVKKTQLDYGLEDSLE